MIIAQVVIQKRMLSFEKKNFRSSAVVWTFSQQNFDIGFQTDKQFQAQLLTKTNCYYFSIPPKKSPQCNDILLVRSRGTRIDVAHFNVLFQIKTYRVSRQNSNNFVFKYNFYNNRLPFSCHPTKIYSCTYHTAWENNFNVKIIFLPYEFML
jgi:hypothetical protein